MEDNQPRSIQQRRNRQNQENRNYTCDICPKSYLSYAALYTHIKSKHPEEKIKTGIRGRPKIDIIDSEQAPQEEDKYKIEQLKDEFYLFLTEQWQEYLIENNLHENKNSQKQNQYIQLVESGNISPLESFPLSLFDAEPELCIHSLCSKLSQSNFSMNKDEMSCNEIFAQFLIEISKHLTTKAYKELCFFIVMIKKVTNNFGEQEYLNYLKENESDEKVLTQHLEYFKQQVVLKQEISEMAIGEILPDLANQLYLKINQYYEKYQENQQFLEFQIIGFNPNTSNENIVKSNERKKSNLIQFIQFFCNWLYEKKYTNSFLELKQSQVDAAEYQNEDDDEDNDDELNLFKTK